MPSDYRVLRIDLGTYLTGYIAGPQDTPQREDNLTTELQNLLSNGWELVSTELVTEAADGTKNQLLLFLAKP
jgi:hypothetical protein